MGQLYPLTSGTRDLPVSCTTTEGGTYYTYDSSVPDIKDLPVSCTTSEGVTHYTYDSPVPDIKDLPVSCTTSEGATHYTNATKRLRTSSLLSLLSDRHVHIRQRRH